MRIAPLAICSLFIIAAPLYAQAEANPRTDDQRINELIRQLEKGDFTAREAAAEALQALPADALPRIKALLADPATSPDTRDHLRQALAAVHRRAQAAGRADLLQTSRTQYAESLRQAYQAVGRRNLAWDDQVITAINCQFGDKTLLRDSAARRRAAAALEKALSAGCDDPLARLLLAMNLLDQEAFGDRCFVLLENVPEQLAASGYSARLQVVAFTTRAHLRILTKRKQDTAFARRKSIEDCMKAIALLPQLKDEPVFEDAAIGYLTEKIAVNLAKSDGDLLRETMPKLLDAASAASRSPAEAAATRIRAHLGAAKAARSRSAPTVKQRNEQRQDLMSTHAVAAELAAAEALKAFPNEMVVLLACHEGACQRQEVPAAESLLNSITALDAGAALAYARHLDMLRSTGDVDALLAYTERVKKSTAIDARVPLLVASTHWSIVLRKELDSRAEYLARKDVWEDIASVYNTYLQKHPRDVVAHGHFAWYAFKFGQFDTANKHFELAGEDGDGPGGTDLWHYSYCRRKAAELLRNPVRQKAAR